MYFKTWFCLFFGLMAFCHLPLTKGKYSTLYFLVNFTCFFGKHIGQHNGYDPDWAASAIDRVSVKIYDRVWCGGSRLTLDICLQPNECCTLTKGSFNRGDTLTWTRGQVGPCSSMAFSRSSEPFVSVFLYRNLFTNFNWHSLYIKVSLTTGGSDDAACPKFVDVFLQNGALFQLRLAHSLRNNWPFKPLFLFAPPPEAFTPTGPPTCPRAAEGQTCRATDLVAYRGRADSYKSCYFE